MNSKQLYYALIHNKITEPFFDGIYSYDNLSDVVKIPHLIICNTDPAYKSGKHWVLFFFDETICEFYDSLGKDLKYYGNNFVKFVNTFVEKCRLSTIQTQPLNTAMCGEYCLFFAYYRCKGYNMNKILNKMSNFTTKQIKDFIYSHFKICTESDCSILQRCKNCH